MRVWEIREGRDREMDYRMGMRDKSEKMEKLKEKHTNVAMKTDTKKLWKKWWENDQVIDHLIVLDIVEVGSYEKR